MARVAMSENPDRYFEPEIETLSRNALEARQEAQLLELLPFVYERSALYRELWGAAGVHPREVRSLADFRARIPFIDKDAIRAHRDRHGDPYGGLLCCDPAELTAIHSTSGTTGDPTLVPEQWEGGSSNASLARDFWELGVRPGDFFVVCMFTFRGPIFTLPHSLGAVPLIFEHTPQELPRFVELVRRYRPTAMYTISGPLLLGLAELEARTGVDLREVFASFRAVIFAGEPLGARARANVERWGIPIYEHSGAGDVGAAFECRERDGMHVHEDIGLYECIEPDAKGPSDAREVADGAVGELVATSLANRAFPMIRYRSDDLDRLTRARCGCGRTHARLWTLGRKGDEVRVAGRSVLPRDVWQAVEALEETSAGLFQIIRRSREVERLQLRVGYAGTPALADLARRVAESVRSSVGVEPEVQLVPNAELLAQGPPHKIPRVARD
jgi:phenylacetate-CoA ligase